ncbi:site-specific DNA-methyltransferase [Enterococcus hirae]|uniref:site-specific DNA-methyltransferase n=1 Tax=Enterococcus hirae TaxID=1354 RepID=UPI0027C06E75|nr:DNA modification methylase [Enterococcus hirae]MDQ2183390.1 DNA modification methylase [Enterococcus hirae]
MQIELMKLQDLKPADYNPRVNLEPGMDEYEKLKKSILEFGFVDPPIFNKRTGNLVGGHQRVTVAKDLGICEEIEVSVVDLPLEKEKALNVALNKISGQWDEEKLVSLLNELEQSDIELTGFSFEEVDELFSELSDSLDIDYDLSEDEYEINIDNEPTSKTGQIYQLGKHRVMCGDSTNHEDLKKLIGDKSIKCLFTSPPYNMGADLYNSYTDDLESKKYIDFNLEVVNLWKNYLQGYLFWNISYNKNTRWEFIEIIHKIVKETGLRFMELIVWDKGHALPIVSKDMLTRQYEDILMVGDEVSISRDMELYYLGSTQKRGYFNKKKGKGISNYWKISTGNTQLDDHKACFPVNLPKKAIELTTDIGEIVADCFGGSGTTLIACEHLKRECLLMEMDPHYVDIIIKRWETLTGEKAVLISE